MHMKGEHPIDDLFARGLRDAEITPPTAVWEGIVRERNWAHITLLQLRRRWGYMLLGLLLLGGGTAYFAAQEGSAGTTQGTTVLASKEPIAAVQAEGVATTSATIEGRETQEPRPAHASPGHVASQEAEHPGGSTAGSNTTSHPHTSSSITSAYNAVGAGKPNVPVASNARPGQDRASAADASRAAADHERSAAAQQVPDINTTLTADMHEGLPSSATGSSTRMEDAPQVAPLDGGITPTANAIATDARTYSSGAAFLGDARWMRTLPSLVTVALGADPEPINAHPEDPYVLRNKRVFVGLQFDWTAVSGKWRGSAEEVAALNRSETWLDRKGTGVVMGLRWRSGLHVALAASASQQRSRFLHTMQVAGDTSTTVDTTWIATAAGPQTVYTWDIVPVMITEPGIEERTMATNTYTQLRMAPELGYGHRFGRWSLGVRVGPMITATLSRKGRTLVPDPVQPDGNELPPNPPIVISADDRSVDERFRLSFGAFAALDIQYHLTEAIMLGAGPVWSTNFAGSGGTVPAASLSELGGAFRLLFDLPERERKTP
jgi:hypothetical protein